MSIYKQVLGDEYYRLHPMLQQRYNIGPDRSFEASGIMHEIKGGPKWLFPLFRLGVYWKLLFPEHGRSIPFTIKNTARIGPDGESQIHWERIFHFGASKRFFNALTSLDEERSVIKDYLGEPPLVYSDLTFHVSDDGSLTIGSLHQRVVLGKVELPLPKFLQGLATVTERYDDKDGVFKINVNVRNPLIGHVFSYEGEFKENA